MKATRKVATNLSVRADLVTEAKRLGLNLSEVFESAIDEAVRCKRRQEWLEENRAAIEEYNDRVRREGTFADRWRKF